MYDIDALEAQWKRYRRKRLLLPAAGGLALLLLAAGGWYVLRGSSGGTLPVPERTTDRTITQQTPRTVTDGSLSPEVPSMRSTPHKAAPPKMQIVFSDQEGKTPSESPSKAKKVTIKVTSKKSTDSVRDIASRFAFAKDKDDALFLARYYYDKKQYKQALKWALETNKLDSDIEESWLIFAKSKARLGQRIEAIRVLQAYYDRSGSARAKKLLGLIRRGKAF